MKPVFFLVAGADPLAESSTGSLAVDLLPSENGDEGPDVVAALKDAREMLIQAAGKKGGVPAQKRERAVSSKKPPNAVGPSEEGVEESFEKKFAKLPREEQMRKARSLKTLPTCCHWTV